MAVSAFKSSSRRSNIASTSYTTPSSIRNPTENSPKKAPLRRSRSVSAFSRTQLDGPSSSSSSCADDFLNKRDNPLFWTTGSPPDLNSIDPQKPNTSTSTSTSTGTKNLKAPSSSAGDIRRGRSVARNADAQGTRKEVVARSLSRVDTGRRNRSLSRNPISRRQDVNSESEAEQECSSLTSFKNTGNSDLEVSNGGKTGGFVTSRSSSSDMDDQLKGLRTWSSQHSTLEPSHDSGSLLSLSHPTAWEDGISTTSSLSGAEESTIKAVCEQMKVGDVKIICSLDFVASWSVRGDSLENDAAANGIYETVRSEVRRAISEIQNDLESAPSHVRLRNSIWLLRKMILWQLVNIIVPVLDLVVCVGGVAMRRSNTTALATTNIADIPPDLVNPSAVELVLDIRREYSKKLEQSHERARKLRADLAVEEQRGKELSRILKEVLPDPKTSNIQKSRPSRKASIERRKMSKRLTEEAMAYFDECVSLSTFDSSDFSSQEDPPLTLVGVTTPVVNRSLLQASSSASAINGFNSHYKEKQESGIENQFKNGHEVSVLMANTLDHSSPTSVNTTREWKSQFSFGRKPTETINLQQDIQKYIKSPDRGIEKGEINLQTKKSNNYDLDEYKLQAAAQSLVFERVFMRNRIESGNLLLCTSAFSNSLSPFASFI
ncbi:hypothetical protein FEM48_Zijuj03G0026400 [Ziziphus jujuba var. spinosa]|uniref:Uncharacterized protein n=1 Tax=Ziziphus jujuba var. spinosa TaxID=714518 RepID=A0A978VMP0_ZIZJJ|nr:hypothetical protein FEM48_Zijuj03G0026400 [Ziziphus jujuba var. spinosa]